MHWIALFIALWLMPAFAQQAPAGGAAGVATSTGVQGYQVGPGDTIKITVYGERDLTGTFPVNQDGQLEFPLIGAVPVNELTSAQIAETLRAALADGYIVDPNVTVSLEEVQSRPIQVLGAVAKPGQYFLSGPTTVLQALSLAGGVSAEGVDAVRLTHSDSEGDVTLISYEGLLTRGEGNATLRGGDVVFVPESRVSVMGQVDAPGEFPFRDDLTISTLIAAAGGPLPTANLGRVYILRDGERIPVNVRKILSGKDEDISIKAGDRVFVGESVF